ncbi:protein translocase subunit secF /protein translocase subunit secD [Flavobacterium micromati]|uniref:Multifunctional fusion protein n=1 Tax=Flavobacterium micromati TaxID=229205 RepID=A0A1M5GZ70_9FLAO|nr:protein translocase subunit SecDF [Flavobacterium micromati]MCL6461776.1 protein translocase subunit SecDF [Flavobacterium micromati]SHG09031.1 protein translocase subunit secF /protein translocase subunit secD [Flavobacterium micromati]
MQNKGLIKFFAILFALVSIYQLSFTFVASKVKNDAKSFANGDSEKEVKYLDSIGKESVFNLGFTNFTFNEVSDKQINKGLDLEGGINVILQISVKDILKGLSNNSKNPVFNKSLADATANQKGNQTYLDAFYDAFDANSKGTVKLASPDIFANRSLQGEGGVDFQMSDADVKKVISRKVDESVESAFGVLRKRIDKFGVTQPNIQKLGESGRILVELPGAKDVDRIKKLLQSTAQLEFWETYKIEEIGNFLMAANETLKKTEIKTTEVKPVVKDSLSALLSDGKDSAVASKGNNPLLDKIIGQGGGPVLGLFSPKDTAVVNGYLKRADIRILLAGDQRYAKFVWGIPTPIKDEKGKDIDAVELYALKGNRDNVPAMSGGVVTDASDTFDQLGKPAVSMQMNGQGAKSWEELTGRAYTQKSNIAIVLDDVVYSAPGVSSGPISGGRSEISGAFDVTQTKDLANVLRAGKLPAAADIVQSEVVGPSLGQEAIDNGTNSAIIGLLIVSLWMMIYYGKAGWYANIALAVNLLFLFGILASIGAVLTLPGIAGIVLTMGTAVDANIIIYERAKEELRDGKTLEQAIKTSYSWTGAMSSITDANVTHILTGAVLFIFGSGPIKGFATTLLIGIVTSLFTSIFIARIFIDWNINKKNNLTFVTNFSKNMFTKFNFDFLGKKKMTYIISSIIVIVSFSSLAINGLDQGVDFVGGRTFQVRFEKPIETETVKAELAQVFDGSAEVKVFGSDNQLKITTKYKVQESGSKADEEVNKLLFTTLKKHFSANMTYEKFVNAYDGKNLGILQASKVGPTVAEDIKTNAYWAVIGAMALVFLYLMISYRKWQYSLGAIAAVAHDVIFVLGIYSLCYKFMPFGMEIDQHFIAAILTVIGYSMNDTVIVFDRVREFLAGKTKGNFSEIVNQSVNTTMSRTINTSLTMIVVLLIMFIFGGESIRGFIFAMLIGILVGTYSSLFIATPILVDTISKEDKKRVENSHLEA